MVQKGSNRLVVAVLLGAGVLQAADAPPLRIADAQQLAKTPNHAALLHGVVILAPGGLPDDPKLFYIEDDTGGISVNPATLAELKLGDRVEVEGALSIMNGCEPELAASRVTRIGSGPRLRPLPISIRDAQLGAASGRLVKLKGRARRLTIGDTLDEVFLSDDGYELRVYTRRNRAARPYLALAAPETTIQVVGVLIPRSKDSFQLRVRFPSDLTLLRGPPLLNRRVTLWLAGSVLVVGLVITLWISTLRRLVRERTREAHEMAAQAQKASQLKSEFLANMSHEIRTPIHGVLGMLSLSLRSDLTPEQRDQLETAHTSTLNLLSLLNEILDLSRIEANRMTLSAEPTRVPQLLQEVADTFSGQARQKGVRLTATAAPGLPEALLCDPLRLKQIVLNLVGNALKFTDSGSVEISAAVESIDTHGLATIVIRVSDTGIGIPIDQQDLIFDMFRQADGAVNRKYGGSGLGLAIASRLVGMMNGSIRVESQPGSGATFIVRLTFPTAPAPAAAPTIPSLPSAGRGAKVLVVEDNAVNRKIATALLARHGYTVLSAHNGQDAIEQYRHAPDIILMDVQMPGIDGVEATRRIRQMESGGHTRVPIVALTASAMPADIARCIDAGMDGHLAKPFGPAELLQVVEQHLAPRSFPQ